MVPAIRGTMVAIIIPTKDRSQFIERLLSYYYSQNCEYKIYIADSSELETHLIKIQETINRFSSKLDITYGHFPKANIEEAKLLILEEVSEEYSAYCGDDDFLVLQTLKECADFLDSNMDYSNCHGQGLIFTTGDDPLKGPISSASEYKLNANEDEDELIRLHEYMNNYWPIWTVRRTDEFKETLTHLREIPSESFRELAMGCLPMIKGKSKLLEGLYVVRQFHQNRFKNPDPLKAILNIDWHQSFKTMKSILVNEINKTSSKSIVEIDELIDELFSDYYSQVLRSRINIIPSSANSLEKIKLFIKEHLKIGYNFYLLFVSKKINIEKLKKYPSENYLSFKEINNFIDNY